MNEWKEKFSQTNNLEVWRQKDSSRVRSALSVSVPLLTDIFILTGLSFLVRLESFTPLRLNCLIWPKGRIRLYDTHLGS